MNFGTRKDWDKFYKDINESVRKKALEYIFYEREDLVIGRRPNEDKKLLIEVNYREKRNIDNQTKYKSWIELWEYDKGRVIDADPIPYSGHIIHTNFMTIDEMSDFLLELYFRIKRADHDETVEIVDSYEDYFCNLNEKEESYSTSEKDLEDYLVKACKKVQWECKKLSPLKYGKGVPDRKIIKDDGSVVFVELKTPKRNGYLSFDQYAFHESLRDQGYEVKVIWNFNQVDRLIK